MTLPAYTPDWYDGPTATNVFQYNFKIFEASVALDEIRSKPDDFRAWLDESLIHARALDEALKGEPVRVEAAKQAFEQVQARCATCHKAYRNN